MADDTIGVMLEFAVVNVRFTVLAVSGALKLFAAPQEITPVLLPPVHVRFCACEWLAVAMSAAAKAAVVAIELKDTERIFMGWVGRCLGCMGS